MSRLDPREPEVRRQNADSRRTIDPRRDAGIRLAESDLRSLRVVGSFRIVNREDMSTGSTSRLIQRGMIHRRTLYPAKGGKPYEVLALTAKGREALESHRETGDRQRFWTGAVKPREMEHDMAIYPACRKEVEEIEQAGGHVRRVVLDFEFKAEINRRMNRPDGPKLSARREEIAAEYGLPLTNDKVMLPDVRIEYTDADGREQHRDIEVVTQHYRGSMRAAKHSSGFRLHNANSPRAAVRDDHHMGFV